MVGSESRSLTDLPLHIIMEILFYLPFQDLENVAKTSKTLRILSNESITYHRTFKNTSSASQWTKRLLFDFLHIVDGKSRLLDYIDSHNISMVDGVHALQSRFDLGASAHLLTQQEHFDAFSSLEAPDDGLKHSKGLSKELQLRNSFGISRQMNHTDKDGLIYLKILQGFQRIATNSHRLFEDESNDPKNHKDSHAHKKATERSEKSNKVTEIGSGFSSPEPSSSRPRSPEPSEPDVVNAKDGSPSSSHDSSSASSLFSEVPRISDLTWSYCDVFKSEEPASSASEGEDSDSSSSVKYLRELQRSSKVSDKKFLFERLNTRLQIGHELGQSNNDEENNLATRRLRHNSELEQSNSLSLRPSLEASASSQEFLSRYQAHLATAEKNKQDASRKKGKQRRHNQAPHRRALVAKITDDNRIFYETLQ
ncbi:LAFA_0F17788g1_1 [Lachancea sp. 'fantastica']|nr:LAFA_0F17788g1_1 [Lachancea sp. 'fantastica']